MSGTKTTKPQTANPQLFQFLNMAVFVPFKALRPTQDTVLKVASRPYDVLNEHEARAESAGNDLSFYHVIKPEIDFPDDFDHYAPEVYQKGKTNFDALVEKGVMVPDSSEIAIYLEETLGIDFNEGLGDVDRAIVGQLEVDQRQVVGFGIDRRRREQGVVGAPHSDVRVGEQ